MGAATQLTDFSDLFTDLLNRSRVDTSQTATETQAKRYINIALQDMHIGLDYRVPWAERKAILTTQPSYNTGTVTITQGSDALAGASTAWATNNAFGVNNVRVGGKIVISGDPNVYEVKTVTNDTNVVLLSKFVKDDVAAVNYTYFEDEYTLDDDFLRTLEQDFFDEGRSVDLIDRQTGRRTYFRKNITNRPRTAWNFQDDFSGSTAPVNKIVFWPPPDQAYSMPYWFITNKLALTTLGVAGFNLVNDDDEPIVPLRYRHAIVFHALYHWYRDKKNSDRSLLAKAEYTDIMLRIYNDAPVHDRRAKFEPRVAGYVRASRRPYSRQGRFGSSDRFDSLLDRSSRR